jgi:hypothetical protein
MEMLKIDLGRGFIAVMEAELFESKLQYNRRDGRSGSFRACNLKWRAALNRNHWYAVAAADFDGISHPIQLHRLLVESPGHLLVDHRDGDTMHNVRTNLRVCTVEQNSQNVYRPRGASRFKGVKRSKRLHKPWLAQIHFTASGRHRCISLGAYSNEEEAARAYDRAALEHFGEFARLNFPLELTPCTPSPA